MLRELSVRHLALIEDVRVELQPGFCAWTGETGAGKSLLLGALGLLLGERGSADLIRAGAEELLVSGLFEIVRPELRTALEAAHAGCVVDDQVILSRRFHVSGRGSAHINDQPVTLAMLKRVGEILVDIHGQRESHSLLQPAYQLQLLDAFGRLDSARSAYLTLAEKVRELRRRRTDLTEQQQQRQRELALIQFEREELDQADIQPGEVVALTQERERLIHAQSLQEFTAVGVARLYDDEGAVVEQLGQLLKQAQTWAGLHPQLADIARRLEHLVPEVEDLAESFRDLTDQFEVDPQRLDEIEKRLSLIRRLETKYRQTADELIAYRATLNARQTTLERQEADLSSIDAELSAAYAQWQTAARHLSKQRSRVAKRLAAETRHHLAELGMPEAQLEAVLETQPISDDPVTGEVPAFGIDTLELMLAANPGEPARPLRKVASGGELSRTMLALKSVLAEHDPVGTLVFDEIDSNVGGRLGDVLGEKLAALGRTHQVICVTHLPQVACLARHQWTIRKQTRGQRTRTLITPLATEAERLEELASMMRGESRSQTTRQEAADMLRAARKKW